MANATRSPKPKSRTAAGDTQNPGTQAERQMDSPRDIRSTTSKARDKVIGYKLARSRPRLAA